MSGNGRTEGKQKVGLQGSKGTKESRKAQSPGGHMVSGTCLCLQH